MVNRVDLGVAVILLAFCAWLYHVTTGFEEVSPLFAQDVPPELFPRLLLWLIVLLSLGLPFEQWLRKEKGRALDKERTKPIRPMAYLTAAFLVAVVVSIGWLGTFLALVLVCAGMPLLWGERRWKVLVPYALVFPSLVMVLFTRVLKVRFEDGALGSGLW